MPGWVSLCGEVQGTQLSGFLLIAYSREAAYELGWNFVERTHKLRDGCLHGTQQFCQKLVAGRHRGQSLYAVRCQDTVGQGPSLDNECFVCFGETGKYLCRRYGIFAD